MFEEVVGDVDKVVAHEKPLREELEFGVVGERCQDLGLELLHVQVVIQQFPAWIKPLL